MAVEGEAEEEEVDTAEVEAEEEDTVAKCVGATHSQGVPTAQPPTTEFVPLSKCSSCCVALVC